MKESVNIRYAPPSDRDTEVQRLQDPWVAQEGPLDALLTQGCDAPLLQRGLAFDSRTTVVWDEDAVQVIQAAPPNKTVLALPSPALIRDGFKAAGNFQRIDYLREGVLIASRYTWEEKQDA